MRTRRKAKYTWLPVLGAAQAQVPASDDDYSGTIFTELTCGAQGVTATTAIGVATLTFDQPQEGASTTVNSSLADRIGSEYIVKRLVGKLFAAHTSSSAATSPTGVLYGAGFFVARADESVNEILPVGGTTSALQIANYNPLISDTAREPWMWRRVWVLGLDAAATPESLGKGLQFPKTTAHYGSVMDGPHIDCKSVRRIRGDERLWFVHACKSFNNFQSDTQKIQAYLDLRILGALRRAKARSAF